MTPFDQYVEQELSKARQKHPVGIHSRHEGLAVVEEELSEVREAVYKDMPKAHLLTELIHTAAMCRRMAEDLHLLSYLN